jgi:hypothetical protein
MKRYMFAFLGVFVLCGIAFAVDQAAATVPGGFESWKGLVKGIGAGVLAGLSVSYLGFLKDKDPAKKWDSKQAGVTLLVGAVMGGAAGFHKSDLTKPEDWYQAGTAVLLAELLGKAAWRNIGPTVTGFVRSFIHKDPPSA